MSFLQAVSEHAFLQWALVAAVLAALSSGVVGTLVVLKRITFMAGGIAHAVLGGMGVAHWLGYSPLGEQPLPPFWPHWLWVGSPAKGMSEKTC